MYMAISKACPGSIGCVHVLCLDFNRNVVSQSKVHSQIDLPFSHQILTDQKDNKTTETGPLDCFLEMKPHSDVHES